jgi:NHL repeat-containing protein
MNPRYCNIVIIASLMFLCCPQLESQVFITTSVDLKGDRGYSGDDGQATNAHLKSPGAVAMDTFGNFYIADTFNNAIRKVIVSNNGTQGIISTIAGVPSGPNTGIAGNCPNGTLAKGNACLNGPFGVAVASTGDVYVADSLPPNSQVRRVDAKTGTISTVAGGVRCTGTTGDGGPATQACLIFPTGVALDASDNLFIADQGDNRIRRVDGKTGIISTVAGDGTPGYSGDQGRATLAQLRGPWAVAIGPQQDFYISDRDNFVIRRVDFEGTITTVAGNGRSGYGCDNCPALTTPLGSPKGLAVDSARNIYIADTDNQRVRQVVFATGLITTFAGGGHGGTAMYCGDGGLATSACLSGPTGVALVSLPTSTPTGIGAAARTPTEGNRLPGDGSNATTLPTNYGVSGGNGNYGGPPTSMYIADRDNTRIRRLWNTECCGSGTLGSLLKSQAGNLYILANEHVLGRPYSSSVDKAVPGEPISQPGLGTNKCQPGDTVATFRFTPTLASNVDAAIAELTPGSKMNRTGYIEKIGIPASTIATPAVGMLVAKYGARTGLTCGKIGAIQMSIPNNYAYCNRGQVKKFTIPGFRNQIVVFSPAFTGPGDSGALVVRSSTSEPVGLHYAGNGNGSVQNPIKEVLVNLAKFGQLSFVSGLQHAVPSCPVAAGTTEAMQETILPDSETARAALAKEAHADRLMKDPAVIGVGVGASEENPFEGVVLLLVDETQRLQAPIPTDLDGVRTRVLYTKPLIPDIQCPTE